MRNRAWAAPAGLCLVCGVDSRALIVFFLSTLGVLILGSVCMLVWSVASGHWSDSEKPKFRVLEVESDGDDQKA